MIKLGAERPQRSCDAQPNLLQPSESERSGGCRFQEVRSSHGGKAKPYCQNQYLGTCEGQTTARASFTPRLFVPEACDSNASVIVGAMHVRQDRKGLAVLLFAPEDVGQLWGNWR